MSLGKKTITTNNAVPTIGISLLKATEEYSLIVLWIGEPAGTPDEKAVYEMLEALTHQVEAPYVDVIQTSILVNHDSKETIEMFPHESESLESV